jgi:phage shock protein E
MRTSKHLCTPFIFLLILLACSGPGTPEQTPAAKTGPTVQQLAWKKIGEGALLIDVRTLAEFKQAHLEGAGNIPFDQIEKRVAELGDDKNRPIVVYCHSGNRSSIARKTLLKLGFTEVIDGGGFQSMLRARE